MIDTTAFNKENTRPIFRLKFGITENRKELTILNKQVSNTFFPTRHPFLSQRTPSLVFVFIVCFFFFGDFGFLRAFVYLLVFVVALFFWRGVGLSLELSPTLVGALYSSSDTSYP